MTRLPEGVQVRWKQFLKVHPERRSRALRLATHRMYAATEVRKRQLESAARCLVDLTRGNPADEKDSSSSSEMERWLRRSVVVVSICHLLLQAGALPSCGVRYMCLWLVVQPGRHQAGWMGCERPSVGWARCGPELDTHPPRCQPKPLFAVSLAALSTRQGTPSSTSPRSRSRSRSPRKAVGSSRRSSLAGLRQRAAEAAASLSNGGSSNQADADATSALAARILANMEAATARRKEALEGRKTKSRDLLLQRLVSVVYVSHSTTQHAVSCGLARTHKSQIPSFVLNPHLFADGAAGCQSLPRMQGEPNSPNGESLRRQEFLQQLRARLQEGEQQQQQGGDAACDDAREGGWDGSDSALDSVMEEFGIHLKRLVTKHGIEDWMQVCVHVGVCVCVAEVVH